MKPLPTFFFALACTGLAAQEPFQRMVLSDYGSISCMGRDGSGNRYTSTAQFIDLEDSFYGTMTAKYGPDGNMWHQRLGNLSGNGLRCIDMAVSDAGEVVVINESWGSSDDNDSTVVAKLDTNGELLWARSFGAATIGTFSSVGKRIAFTSNGDILAGGVIRSDAGGMHDDLFLTRLNASGTVLWSKRIAPPVTNTFNRIGGIVEDASGAIIVFGRTMLNTEGSWLMKLSGEGQYQWCRSFDTNASDMNPLFLAPEGTGYALFYNSLFSGPTGHLYRINTNANGNVTSATYYLAGGQTGQVTGVTPLPGGGYAMAGYFTYEDVYNNDATLFTTDAAGAVQWAKRYGSTGQEFFNAVEPGTDGSFLAGGSGQLDSLTQVVGGLPTKCYLVRTDANGEGTVCDGAQDIINIPRSFTDMLYAQIVTDETGWTNAAVTTAQGYEAVSVCVPADVHEVEQTTLGVFPNPANDRITLSNSTTLRSVQVLATDGRLLSEYRMGTQVLDVRALPPGAYVLHGIDVNGDVVRGRFVKE